MTTQVAIIGAGPAGLLLSHLLNEQGIATKILENRNESYIKDNWRGGMVEHEIADVLLSHGIGEKLQFEKHKVRAVQFQISGENYKIEIEDKNPVLYNQHDLVSDLIDKINTVDNAIIFEGKAQRYEKLETSSPRIHYTLDAQLYTLDCDFVIGCDGYRGISRRVIPVNTRKEHSEELPYAWLDWLVDVAPCVADPVYAWHANGFAMQMPTPDGKTRFHMQILRGTEVDDLPLESELWDDLESRLAMKINKGNVIQQKLDYMRSFHTDNWQYERLYIAGDAAHQVSRTAAKGLNMALADAIYLAEALIRFYKKEDKQGLDNYTDRALTRSFKIKEFTSEFTELMHPLPEQSPEDRAQQAQNIRALLTTKESREDLIKHYVGLPL